MARYNGSETQQGSTATGDTTARSDQTIFADASGGPVTITLPEPSVIGTVTVKKVDSSSNAVTIATPEPEHVQRGGRPAFTADA